MSRTTRAADISPQQSLNCHKIQSFRKHCLHGEEQWEILFFTTHGSHLSHWKHFFFFVREEQFSLQVISRWYNRQTKLTSRYINYRTRDSRRKNRLGFSTAPRWVWKSDLWRWVVRGVKSPHAVEVCVFPALLGCLLPKSHRLQLTCMRCHYF